MAALPASFYARPTLTVAADLIGCVLVHDHGGVRCSGRIVEVEAYIGEADPACHAAAGPTARNQPLYGPAGLAYVYFNYGMHWLVNAVTEAAGAPAAVLVRALEPLTGLEAMRARRGEARAAARDGVTWSGRDAHLCRGPGNLTRALGITGAQNHAPLSAGPLRIHAPSVKAAPLPVSWSGRVGIRLGQDRPWRAYVAGHPAVSGAPR